MTFVSLFGGCGVVWRSVKIAVVHAGRGGGSQILAKSGGARRIGAFRLSDCVRTGRRHVAQEQARGVLVRTLWAAVWLLIGILSASTLTSVKAQAQSTLDPSQFESDPSFEPPPPHGIVFRTKLTLDRFYIDETSILLGDICPSSFRDATRVLEVVENDLSWATNSLNIINVEIAKLARLVDARMRELREQINIATRHVEFALKQCNKGAAEQAAVQTPESRRNLTSILREIRARAAAINRSFVRIRRLVAEIKQHFATLRLQLAARGIQLPEPIPTRKPSPRIEFGTLLGWPVSLNNPNLDPFNQALKRGAQLSGGGEIVGAWPLADRFDVRFGGMVFHAASAAERIDNILVPGSQSVTGRYNTTALLGTLGLGFQPISRWYVSVDGGFGVGFNDLLIRNAATGATIVDKRETVTAGMVRGAVTYSVTDQLRIGGFLMHLLTRDMNAQVVGGSPFSMRGIGDTTVGLIVVVTPRFREPL